MRTTRRFLGRIPGHLLIAWTGFLLLVAASPANAESPKTSAAQERILVRDDFEQGIVKRETHNAFGDKTGYFLNGHPPRLRAHVAGVDPGGRSGIFLETGEAASGTRSIRLQKATGMNLGHLPALSWWLYNDDVIASGTLKIAFAVKIPEVNGNDLMVLARRFGGAAPYHSTKKEAISLHLTANRISFFGESLAVSQANWTRIELAIPVGVPSGRATLTVKNAELGERVREAVAGGTEPGVDWIGFLMPGAKEAGVQLDDVEIVVAGERPRDAISGKKIPADRGDWAAAPAALLDVFPPSTAEPPGKAGQTVLASDYYPSGSTWQKDLDERRVFHREIKHVQDAENSFALRVGKGGQIYSLRGAFGESLPPSWRPEGPSSPWNDEVWQFVAICSKYNDTLSSRGKLSDEVKERVARTGFPRLHYFVHNSGAYMEGDLSGLDNLYCPMLAAAAPPDGRTYRTVNWGLVPWNTPHRSPLLYYVQTRDIGEGIIELTWVVHNFSVREDMVFDWLNAPWGGTRLTSLPHHYVSAADGRLMDRREVHQTRDMWTKAVDVRATGGWNLSCANDQPDSPSLALVFGRDRHLEEELGKAAKGEPHCQFANSIYRDASTLGSAEFRDQDWRECPENAHRNYDVAVVIPKFRLAPGTTIWYRSFLVVHRKDRAIELAKSLVNHVDYGLLAFDPASTPLVPVYVRNGRVTKGRRSSLPAFELFAKPVPGTLPLFLVENLTTGQEIITTDMYAFFHKEKLNWGIPADHPDADYYNSAHAYRLEKHNTRWKRLLGYAYLAAPEGGTHRRISEVVGPAMFPEADAYHRDLWVKAGKSPEPPKRNNP